MPTHKRILIGALGAFTPILLNLLVADFNAIPTLTRYDLLGYIVRPIVLLIVGGLVGYFHKSVRNTWTMFQLGIAAPALITASINAKPSSQASAASSVKPPAGISALLPVAFAQAGQARIRIAAGGLSESPLEQFWRGLSSSGIQLGPPDFQIAQYKLILNRLEQEWGKGPSDHEGTSNNEPPVDGGRDRNERDAALASLRQALNNAQDLQKGVSDDDVKLKPLLDALLAAQQAIDQAEATHDQALERLRGAIAELRASLARWFNASDPKELFASISRLRPGLDSPQSLERRDPELQKLMQLLKNLDEARKAGQASMDTTASQAESLIKNHEALATSRQSISKGIRDANDSRTGGADRIKRLGESIKAADDSRVTLLDIEKKASEDSKGRTTRN